MHTISQLRKLLYISLTFLFYSSTILAQQTSVEGLVYFHGSRGNGNKIRPVSNVKISTLNNKAAYSDQKGRFKLSLKNVSLDEPIFIKIEKKGYEVIDQNNLQYFHLDQKDKLRIFLAKKGYIKTQRSKFLQSAKAAHIEEKERLLDLLAFGGTAEKAALKTIGNRTGMKMYSAYDAEQLLLQMSGDLEELQSDYALELTYINPDFASKLFKDAMNAFLENDPEETVALLREEEQEKSFLELLNQIEKGKDDSIAIKRIIEKRGRLLEQIKNNYVLQIISMHQYFYFKEANNALKKLATINRYMPTHKHTELIKKFDLYKIIEPSTPEVNLAAVNKEVENNTPPSPLQSN
jgi:hypothetical protein